MRAILQSLLIIAVTIGYVTGPYLTVEIEHSHEVCQSHGHQHAGGDHDHSHHPRDHGPVPTSGVPESDGTDGDSHSHTHVVSLGTDIPITLATHKVFMANRIGASHPAVISEFIPDGPCFRLIKPPQLA